MTCYLMYGLDIQTAGLALSNSKFQEEDHVKTFQKKHMYTKTQQDPDPATTTQHRSTMQHTTLVTLP